MDARWGDSQMPLAEWKDVTDIVRVLIVDGGITSVPVEASLFTAKKVWGMGCDVL